MKLGIGSYAYAWASGTVTGQLPAQPMDVMRFVRRAAEQDVHLVQIADNLPLHTLSPMALDALAHEATALTIAIEVGTRGIQPDHLQTYLEIAQRLESPILRTLIDSPNHHPSVAEAVQLLQEAKPAFEAANVTLALENHDRFQTETFVKILNQVDSTHIGICLDTVNSFGALEGPAAVVERLAPFVVNLHIKDFTIRRVDHTMGFVIEGTPAGQGRLDIPWLLEILCSQSAHDFNAILELWTPPETALEATIQKETNWVAESVRYLRTLIAD